MDEGTDAPAPAERAAAGAARVLAQVRVLTAAALTALVVAAVLSTAMIARRVEQPCQDGTVFPAGTTDFTCYAHPLGLQGGAVLTLCLALVALVLALYVVAKHLLAPSVPGEG